MELLSQNPALRNHVRRIVFCRPMFEPMESSYEVWTWNKKLSRRESIQTEKEKEANLRAYSAALKEQSELLRSGIYTESCGRCISRFPWLSSIFISDGIPQAVNRDIQITRESPRSQRQHPNMALRRCLPGEDHESADRHIGMVLKALAMAKIQIEELVFYNEWGPGHEFSLTTVPGWPSVLDLSKLSRLDLWLENALLVPNGPDWSSAICPLLRRMPALTELYLRSYENHNFHPTVTELWELNAPKLTVLAVTGLKLAVTGFCGFLRRHSHLSELTLYNVRVDDGQWFSIFKVIREHSGLEDLEIRHVGLGGLFVGISTFAQPELSGDVTWQLYDYLHGKGDWTPELELEWSA